MDDKKWMSIDQALVADHPNELEDPKIYRSLHSLWPEWHAKAKCLGMNDEVFFGSSSPEKRPAYTRSEIQAAKQTCYVCPVFEHCLRQAISNRETYGVWAATTMKERSKIFEMIDNGLATENQIVHALVRAKNAAEIGIRNQ